MNIIRTRFAPSPTGEIHIGNLRTALYEYLIAKKYNGKFILRIEDTDKKRFLKNSFNNILNIIKIFGINYDEGPRKEGDYGPYFQSKRLDLYKYYAEKLIKKNKAYYCFCDNERLINLKKEQTKKDLFYKYDNSCRNLDVNIIRKNLQEKKPYVIRQKNPKIGISFFDDLVFGKIKIKNKELEDQILVKSDGYPTYNFANVIDDHLMKITHIIRGSEYLSSTPKYNLLYDFFNWKKPTYIHLPLILNNKGEKLSKRDGDQSVKNLIKEGYLIQAIINFIVLLGWNPKTKKEFFTLKELEEIFNIEGISKSPSIFNIKKLKWMNGEYIRKLSLNEFHELALPYIKKILKKSFDTFKLASILKNRIKVLNEIPFFIDFFNELNCFNIELYNDEKNKISKKIALKNLLLFLKSIKTIDDFSFYNIDKNISKIIFDNKIKKGQLLLTLRIALTGKKKSAGSIFEILDILKKDESIKRINLSIDRLKKEVK